MFVIRERLYAHPVQAKAKPLKVGTTRTISKSLRKYLSNIPGKQESKNQGTTIK
jgi:hypothetical protein